MDVAEHWFDRGVRVVPTIDEVATALARLGDRANATLEDDPVFRLARRRTSGRERGSTAVNKASLVQVQTWMGHAHIQDHGPVPTPLDSGAGRSSAGRRRLRDC